MKNTRNFLLYAAVLLTFLDSSCSMGGDLGAPEGEPGVPPGGYVMKFERRGGYLGTHDEFWIYPDGRVLNPEGKSARIRPDLVAKWMETISPAAILIPKKKPLISSVAMDCHMYGITVYEKGEARTLTLLCTDMYSHDKGGEISLIDIGPIRDTLVSLSWE